MNLSLLLLALCPALAPQTSADPAGADELVRLRDGRLLVGQIADHDLDGFELQLARTGGRFRLGWSDLFPGEAERMRQNLGYVVLSAVPTTTADRFLLKNGREIVGRIVKQDARGFEVRTLDSTILIPAAMIAAPPEQVVVEASSVLTPEQFYQERVTGVAAGDAQAQYNFAQELEQVFALERAQERYEAAAALAGAAQDQALLTRVNGALEQLAKTIANRAEAQALEEIRRAMYRERFEAAEQMLADFDAAFPQPKLRGQFLDLRQDFAADRDAAITRYLARNWFSRVVAEVKNRALDRDAAMDELLAWIETDLPLTVRQKLVLELQDMNDELDETALDALWAKRVEQGAVRHRASFGEGSWVLGPERAQKGMVEEKEDPAATGKSAEQKEMEERVQRYLKNLETQRRAASGAERTGEATADDWWRQASVSERFQFLLAYYAEFVGDYEVTNFEFAACTTCGGTGIIESIEISAEGANQRRSTCPTCHGVAVRRALSFR